MISIALQPFDPADIDRMLGWIDTPEELMLWSGTHFTFPLTADQLESRYQRAVTSTDMRMFKVVDTATGTHIGHIELTDIDLVNENAKISCVLLGDRAYRGKGLGSQMIDLLLDCGFGELNLHRITLFVFDTNTAAIRAYERSGFVTEGRIREVRKLGDTYWSLYQMGILQREWQQKKPLR